MSKIKIFLQSKNLFAFCMDVLLDRRKKHIWRFFRKKIQIAHEQRCTNIEFFRTKCQIGAKDSKCLLSETST